MFVFWVNEYHLEFTPAKTFTKTSRIRRTVIAVADSFSLHLPSVHQYWKMSQQLCLLRGTRGFLSTCTVLGIKLSFQDCNSQISPMSLQCWQGYHKTHFTGEETVVQSGFLESLSLLGMALIKSLAQYFFKVNVHKNHLDILVNGGFQLNHSWWDLRFCISNKFLHTGQQGLRWAVLKLHWHENHLGDA